MWLRSTDLGDPDDLALVVSVRHHAQVELTGDLAKADRVRLLDENDKAALLRIMRGGGSYTNRVAEITNGRSHVISVADTAIAFYRDGEEVQRLPIHMVSRQVNLVRW